MQLWRDLEMKGYFLRDFRHCGLGSRWNVTIGVSGDERVGYSQHGQLGYIIMKMFMSTN